MRGRTMRLLFVLILVSILSPHPACSQSSGLVRREFTSHDDFVQANAVRLPKPVLAALLASREAVAGKAWIRNNPGADSNSLFAAFPVALSGPKERDYVVVRKKPLIGADNDWFWGVRSSSPKPSIVLFCSALVVDLLASAHNSFQDIRCTWESPGGDGYKENYQFDGRQYVLRRKIQTHRRPTDSTLP